MAEMKTIIRTKNLTMTRKGKNILNDITLDIKQGDRIAIVGGNGAGKTTLVENILGIQKKSSGSIEFEIEFEKSPLEKVGVQFQDAKFPIGLTVRGILDFFLLKTKNPNHKLIDELISILEVNKFLDVDSSKISGGQAQKLNIILALSNTPEVLILDELTTGLDVLSRVTITRIIKEYVFENNRTMLMVTHHPEEIDKLSNKIILVKDGSVEEQLTYDQMIKKYGSSSKFLETLH